MPIGLQVKAPLMHARDHPVLLNPRYTLWVLSSWSAMCGVQLSADIRERICSLHAWSATTAKDVIHTLMSRLVSHPKLAHEQLRDLKLVVGGGMLLQVDSPEADRPFLEAFSAATIKNAVLPTLHFVRFRSPPAAVNLGAPVNLFMCNQDGAQFPFVCAVNEQLAAAMYAWADHTGIGIDSVRFLLDGTRVQMTQTPAELDLEDGEIIDVMVEMLGD
mmetsp:Transcript_29682/g.76712  ORF Transcript_29682/g.76712 Transcript_29682/m.76712 type:complete len:217 (+) Transcript_29682:3-653(+)